MAREGDRCESGPAPQGRGGWFCCYVLGLGLGSASALYGVLALLMGRTFLPGYHADALLVKGGSALALALAYLTGGVYLLLRLFVERKAPAFTARKQVYLAQNVLLGIFIAALAYTLWRVGSLASAV